MPGLGRQPQAPSSAVPAAPADAVPGVRSGPRPAPAPAPRPPPRGGSVKPGGEGGGGGSPTRAGAGGGGGPAGGELAANTFPMVAGGSACSRPGLGSHPVRHAQPNPLPPPPPPSPRPAYPIGPVYPEFLPRASVSGLALRAMARSPTHFFERLFLLVPTLRQVKAHLPALPLARGTRVYWLVTPRVPLLACHWLVLSTLQRPLTCRLRPSSEGSPLPTQPRGEVETVIGRLWPLQHSGWLRQA